MEKRQTNLLYRREQNVFTRTEEEPVHNER